MKTRSGAAGGGVLMPPGAPRAPAGGGAGAAAGAAGGGKRRGGRRTKEAWRKNVDVRDVDAFLEDQRLEERLGKFSAKADSELFALDTRGDAAPADGGAGEGAGCSAKQRRRAALPATPRCYRVLLPTSEVPDPNAKRNVVNPPGARATALSRLSARRRAVRRVDEGKADMSRDNRARVREERRRAGRSRQEFRRDVWEQVPSVKWVAPSLRGEWLSAEAVRLNVPAERRVGRPRPARTLPRPLPPALPPPHPGQSYNPSYEEHQELLREVAAAELGLMKKEKHLERVTTHMFKLVRKEQRQAEWLQEMMSGLPAVPSLVPSAAGAAGAAGAAEAEAEESGGEYAAVNPPVRNRKKDTKARRKQKEQKLERERLKRARLDKRKIADVYKLRFLQRDIAAADARQADEREGRALRRTRRLSAAPPLLNAHRPRAPGEPFLAPGDLAPALRAHDAGGTNLLRERFESLQRRGVLAPSRIFLRKKLRLRTYYKPGHKVSRQDVQRYLAAAAPPAASPAAQ